MDDVVFSFVIDAQPKFAFQGVHLARSLFAHCSALRFSVVVQVTPEVGEDVRHLFTQLGCIVCPISRFGDGKYCNKLSQLEALVGIDCRYVVLMDADMIAVDDLSPLLSGERLRGRVVGAANPSIEALEALAHHAGMFAIPARAPTDCSEDETLDANLNGGLYVIPRPLLEEVFLHWRRWTTWVLDNIGPLAKEGKAMHADQVGMWLAIQMAHLPFDYLEANWNFNPERSHRSLDPKRQIAILHYHGALTPAGQITEPQEIGAARIAVQRANAFIAGGYNARLFWDLRYALFPERGSGMGSRAENAEYKRQILKAHGIENAHSILDVGCGDLEVLGPLRLTGYFGIDQSHEAVRLAREARPDLRFEVLDAVRDRDDIPDRDLVLCLEVLLHQSTRLGYQRLLETLAAKATRTLIVSGLDDSDNIPNAPSVFFYEPLGDSLRAMGVFRTVERIGSHTSVALYRCDR